MEKIVKIISECKKKKLQEKTSNQRAQYPNQKEQRKWSIEKVCTNVSFPKLNKDRASNCKDPLITARCMTEYPYLGPSPCNFRTKIKRIPKASKEEKKSNY